jgi:hypothetical protein
MPAQSGALDAIRPHTRDQRDKVEGIVQREAA